MLGEIEVVALDYYLIVVEVGDEDEKSELWASFVVDAVATADFVVLDVVEQQAVVALLSPFG